MFNNQFYILRHGKTDYQLSKKDRVYPLKGNLTDVALAKEGRAQIKRVAQELKDKKIDMIYSSDFLRTKQTSLIVAKEIALSKKKIIFCKELRDNHLGIYHGRKKDERYYQERDKALNDFYHKPEKGESKQEVMKRVVDFVKKIDKNKRDKKILIVSHGEPLWLLEGFVEKRRKEDLIDEKLIKKYYIQTGELRKLN